MPHIPRSGPVDDGEREQLGAADFVEPDNDNVVHSRQDHLIDRTDAFVLPGGFGFLGAKRIDRLDEAEEVFDSEQGEARNAGLARRDVLFDGERW